MGTRVLGTLLAVGLLLGGVAACGGDDDSPLVTSDGPASPAASTTDGTEAPDPADEACSMITEEELVTLSGESSLGEPLEVDLGGGLPVCQWMQGTTRVQVGTFPSTDWARRFPQLLAQLEASGTEFDKATRKKLDKSLELLESGGTIDEKAACDLFSTMVELQGAGSGQDFIINLVPDAKTVLAITGQTCTGGQYTTVMLMRPGLTGSDDEVARVRSTLRAVHTRAVQG